jgi:hypothetical protein
MKSRYSSLVIMKLGGTRPVNGSYMDLLQGKRGVTYDTVQAVIDIRLRNNIVSHIREISIPEVRLNRTNVKQMIVEVFDHYHQRIYREKTRTMRVKMNRTRTRSIRFIRISILKTTDNDRPVNVTVSIKGCFYRKNFTKKIKRKRITTTPLSVTATLPTGNTNVCVRIVDIDIDECCNKTE